MSRSTVPIRVAALVAVALGLSACGAGSSDSTTAGSAPSSGTIGLAMPTKTAQRWVDDGTNMVKQFQVLGYKTDMQYANDNVQTQISQIESMIAAHDKALVIGAVDGSALKAVLQKAADAKIPILSYDRLIRDSPNVNYYATFDNFKVGVLQASYLVRTLPLKPGSGPFTIELYAGAATDNNATFFFNGAMSVLKPYLKSGQLVVPDGRDDFKGAATLNWDPKVAQARMTKFLAGRSSSFRLDAVLAPNDGVARGIVAALTGAGYGSASKKLPVVTGQDAELDSVKAIADGKQGQTVYKDTRELAKVAVQITDSILTGGVPAVNDTKQYDNGVKTIPSFLLQPVSVDKNNYRSVLIDGGYYTAAQVG